MTELYVFISWKQIYLFCSLYIEPISLSIFLCKPLNTFKSSMCWRCTFFSPVSKMRAFVDPLFVVEKTSCYHLRIKFILIIFIWHTYFLIFWSCFIFFTIGEVNLDYERYNWASVDFILFKQWYIDLYVVVFDNE